MFGGLLLLSNFFDCCVSLKPSDHFSKHSWFLSKTLPCSHFTFGRVPIWFISATPCNQERWWIFIKFKWIRGEICSPYHWLVWEWALTMSMASMNSETTWAVEPWAVAGGGLYGKDFLWIKRDINKTCLSFHWALWCMHVTSGTGTSEKHSRAKEGKAEISQNLNLCHF